MKQAPKGQPAYDYDKQQWLNPGPEADALNKAQFDEHMELMKDPAYRKFIGVDNVTD